MDMQMLADPQKLTYISYEQTLDLIWMTYQEQWMIGTDGERESEKSMLSA